MPEQEKKYIEELIARHMLGMITPEEQLELDAWLHRSPANKAVLDKLANKQHLYQGLNELDQYDVEEGWKRIRSQAYFAPSARARVLKRRRMLAVAASLLLLAGAAALYKWGATDRFFPEDRETATAGAAASGIAAPESNHAQITLEDGSIINLDSMTAGSVKRLHNIEIVKNQDGKIVYRQIGTSASDTAEIYNTLSNPRGSRVIDVSMSDGSRVWLNAGSSIRYPIVFLKNTRKVLVSGEAYFEVKRNAADKGGYRPFTVQHAGPSPDWEVAVLGTRFNVNTYADEQETKISLLEGSVKVQQHRTGRSQLLQPGKQLSIDTKTNTTTQIAVNEQEVLAWKNGIFLMENTELSIVMRQISRWYDVDIVYPDGVPDAHLSGDIPNTMGLDKVLQVLELSGIRFRTKGKTVMVLN